MKIGKLVRDPALLPKLPKKATFIQEADRAARRAFLLRRARIALTANPSWKGTDPDDVKDANAAALKSLLAGEIAAAGTKVATLRTAMADTTKTELVGIDDASIDPLKAAAGKPARFRLRYAALMARTPEQLRGIAIVTSAWTTLAGDPAITDADIHTLVSRRLMTAERMLWYVGTVGSRSWRITPANEWKDGWRRIFEYPRLPVEAPAPFATMCNAPAGKEACDPTGKMPGWRTKAGGQLQHEYAVNPLADPLWKGPRYFFGVATSAAFDVGAVYRDATETDERFVVRLPKASFPTGAFMIAELTAGDGLPPGGGALTKVSGTGDGTITWNQTIFDGLHFAKAGANDPAEAVLNLFEPFDDFRKRNLLFCDTVIQCLHLEALVRVKSKRDGNRTWFKTLVDANPDDWLRIIHPSGSDDNQGPVFLVGEREPRFFERRKGILAGELQIGDHVIIFNHPAYDKALESVNVWRLENAMVVAFSPRLFLQGHGTNPLPFTSERRIKKKDGNTRDEPSMRLNMLGHFNRRLIALRKAARKENERSPPRTVVNDFDSKAVLVQRTDIGPYSGFNPADFMPKALTFARWWLRWTQDKEQNEPDIAADSDWARWVWQHQKVELTGGFGYFPLWLPTLNKKGPFKGKPVRNSAGKIPLVDNVVVSQPMAPGWSWYFAKNESPLNIFGQGVTVRRPKVS